jgi:hypothetical protein
MITIIHYPQKVYASVSSADDWEYAVGKCGPNYPVPALSHEVAFWEQWLRDSWVHPDTY